MEEVASLLHQVHEFLVKHLHSESDDKASLRSQVLWDRLDIINQISNVLTSNRAPFINEDVIPILQRLLESYFTNVNEAILEYHKAPYDNSRNEDAIVEILLSQLVKCSDKAKTYCWKGSSYFQILDQENDRQKHEESSINPRNNENQCDKHIISEILAWVLLTWFIFQRLQFITLSVRCFPAKASKTNRFPHLLTEILLIICSFLEIPPSYSDIYEAERFHGESPEDAQVIKELHQMIVEPSWKVILCIVKSAQSLWENCSKSLTRDANGLVELSASKPTEFPYWYNNNNFASIFKPVLPQLVFLCMRYSFCIHQSVNQLMNQFTFSFPDTDPESEDVAIYIPPLFSPWIVDTSAHISTDFLRALSHIVFSDASTIELEERDSLFGIWYCRYFTSFLLHLRVLMRAGKSGLDWKTDVSVRYLGIHFLSYISQDSLTRYASLDLPPFGSLLPVLLPLLHDVDSNLKLIGTITLFYTFRNIPFSDMTSHFPLLIDTVRVGMMSREDERDPVSRGVVNSSIACWVEMNLKLQAINPITLPSPLTAKTSPKALEASTISPRQLSQSKIVEDTSIFYSSSSANIRQRKLQFFDAYLKELEYLSLSTTLAHAITMRSYLVYLLPTLIHMQTDLLPSWNQLLTIIGRFISNWDYHVRDLAIHAFQILIHTSAGYSKSLFSSSISPTVNTVPLTQNKFAVSYAEPLFEELIRARVRCRYEIGRAIYEESRIQSDVEFLSSFEREIKLRIKHWKATGDLLTGTLKLLLEHYPNESQCLIDQICSESEPLTEEVDNNNNTDVEEVEWKALANWLKPI